MRIRTSRNTLLATLVARLSLSIIHTHATFHKYFTTIQCIEIQIQVQFVFFHSCALCILVSGNMCLLNYIINIFLTILVYFMYSLFISLQPSTRLVHLCVRFNSCIMKAFSRRNKTCALQHLQTSSIVYHRLSAEFISPEPLSWRYSNVSHTYIYLLLHYHCQVGAQLKLCMVKYN